jgi:7,8-dihydroneopterin aldolase/epimerase/oxygenase
MQDKILLEGLETRCIIGIFPWERKIRQKITVDFEFPSDIRKAAKSDRIEDAIDYKKIAKHTLHFVSKSNYRLIETLAENLAKSILKNFPVRILKLRLFKPGAVRNAKNVGVEIVRKRK